MQKSAIRILLFSLIIIVICFVAFWAGLLYNQREYSNSLIAVKYIDGKYGEAFYGVEVTGMEDCGNIKVYAKIFINSLTDGYYHNCGNIGIAENWIDARKQFGDIQ